MSLTLVVLAGIDEFAVLRSGWYPEALDDTLQAKEAYFQRDLPRVGDRRPLPGRST